MRLFGSALAVGFLTILWTVLPAMANAPDSSPRPALRPPESTPREPGNMAFHAWLTAYRTRAIAAGIRPDVIDRAMAGLRYNTDVIQKDRTQSEFTKTIWDYLDTAASDLRIRNGQVALNRHRATLDQIEAKYGVDKQIIVAIWGLESAYGAFRGTIPVIEAMATLAHDGRRAAFFETQLTAALSILQNGDVALDQMKGSWAGAMGHTQFMPTSYLAHAVDFTGDGKRDIWSDDARDALASTAAYLAANGWTPGQPWGVEVRIPNNFNYAQARRENTKMPSEWARIGVLDMAGNPVPNHGPASVLIPAGAKGAAFLIFENFEVLESYNTADAYVIGVGHLADRITGAAAIQGKWPRGDRALNYDERIELQERLTGKGFDTKKIDGKIGPLTIDAVRRYQASIGLVPDGYASLRLLERLRS